MNQKQNKQSGGKAAKTAITPTRAEDYPQWYQQVVRAADMAEPSDVRGCMVIKPWGYALWENVQRVLDGMFKATGHRNAYFPLFIPKSYLEKEAEHVEGFAKECAVVTHHRLEDDGQGGLKPAGELEEPLVVRPTSEMIIGATYAKWVQSYRDLPILINQWANVVRWEMRTRLFLRTAEFLWQEGHTVHATEAEAREETAKMHEVYARFAEDYMAMPVIKGAKPEHERFPGAVETYSIEAMMQDRKALQAGTSHFLGQNFARAQDIEYLGEDNQRHHAWTTSWGVSTRLIGGLIMTHSDDDGLVLPPLLAPAHVVILPILPKGKPAEPVLSWCEQLAEELRGVRFGDRNVEVELDTRDLRGGEKTWQWVKRGVPIRLEVGERDIAEDSVFMARRDLGVKDKHAVKRSEFVATVGVILQEIQDALLGRAKAFREENSRVIDDLEAFKAFFTPENAENPEIHGGFVKAHWDGTTETAERVQKELGVTIRCLPEDGEEPGSCIITGRPSAGRVVWAKAY
ncbi:proline--tRNA ligase [Mucisphaera calidilacus]|uniref:Proline--tRNA ligase n=1 Tax=Mucisphaera calidilacus TaxID=2527982 RepID=A0A518BW45_9BACT|nr:proline--tRNA ligase [Mucisphaera calidilacus]QDU71199.1 Proline--tRNA ligase [Mucisphaera calidilacus]